KVTGVCRHRPTEDGQYGHVVRTAETPVMKGARCTPPRTQPSPLRTTTARKPLHRQTAHRIRVGADRPVRQRHLPGRRQDRIPQPPPPWPLPTTSGIPSSLLILVRHGPSPPEWGSHHFFFGATSLQLPVARIRQR